VVAAASGRSGSEARDKRMTKDILFASHYAEVSFVPQSYEGALSLTGDSTIQVTGVFTLRGTPHELTVPMKVHIAGAQWTAKGRFAVPYVKWGLKDPSTFVLRVSKEVEIDLTLTGTLQR
jgi:polyisoprenoid-binding protein YceI